MVTVSMLCAPLVACAADTSCDYKWNWVSSACQRVTRVAKDGTWDLYLTGYGWHIDGYDESGNINPNSWGGGAGKHWTDANGNQDILFGLVFLDSHEHIQPIVGYARQWYTKPVLGGLSLGGGYFLGITARSDIAHYLPVPLALPIGSVRYQRASIMATWIPRIPSISKGDVAFFWGRYEF